MYIHIYIHTRGRVKSKHSPPGNHKLKRSPRVGAAGWDRGGVAVRGAAGAVLALCKCFDSLVSVSPYILILYI